MKLVNESLNILKPKSEEDIINDLSKLGQEEKDKKLKMASIAGQLDVVKLLIEAGADVNNKDKYGDTPLIYSSILGYLDITKILIEAKADINAKNNYGNTALIWALRNNHKEIVDLLKKYGAKDLSLFKNKIFKA